MPLRDGGIPAEPHRSKPFTTHSLAGGAIREAVAEKDGSVTSSHDYASAFLYTKRKDTTKNCGAPTGWRPKSLRKATLLGFAVVFIGCMAALGELFAYSHSHHGLLTVDTHLHYLWTYAPTLFFTIVGAFWSRVAYRINQMQPWRMILERQSPKTEALLVDYVTPITFISLFKAMKERHLPVVMVLLALIALQLVTVLSTGLFDFEYLQVQKNATLSRLDTITGLNHDFSTISASPDLTIYSVQNTNLSYPEGTSSLYAVPKLSYPAGERDTATSNI
jgi:hypothetical protein